jgi:hypothetical protein
MAPVESRFGRLARGFSDTGRVGVYFEHFRKPLPITGKVCAFWRTKEDFARDGIPPKLLEMMPGYGTLAQGHWNARETFEYRFNTSSEVGLFACLAMLRGRLLMAGFAATDASALPPDDTDWISPADPDMLLNYPRFQKKD